MKPTIWSTCLDDKAACPGQYSFIIRPREYFDGTSNVTGKHRLKEALTASKNR